MIRDILSGILDLIYPPFCVTCGKAGEDHLCAGCIEQIKLIGRQHCRTCGMPVEQFRCVDCDVRQYAFESAASAGVYEGVLQDAIHALKYAGRIVLADPLAEIMVRCFPDTGLAAGQIDLVVPVPIHRSRLVERGFNQSEELASRFCKRTGVKLGRDALIKTLKTRHQVDLPQDQRYINVQGAFTVPGRAKVAGKRVLLIDDVFTTGSTLNESAQALLEAGAASVSTYTLARSI